MTERWSVADSELMDEMLIALKQAEKYLSERVIGTGGYGETKLLPELRKVIAKAEQ